MSFIIAACIPAQWFQPGIVSLTSTDQAKAETGDACDIAASHSGAAGIISLFGLQQLPEAHLALANWVKALAPGLLSAATSASSCLITACKWCCYSIHQHEATHVTLTRLFATADCNDHRDVAGSKLHVICMLP